MSIAVVILAAGKGTRMKSALPKVLHPIAGKSMLEHVLDCAETLKPQNQIIVYGHEGRLVQRQLVSKKVDWAEQAEQKGTGHAVLQAVPYFGKADKILILYGDVPLIQSKTLKKLLETDKAISLLTVKLADPSGYGRIVRNAQNQVNAIVEQKDATPEQLEIQEVNTGIMAVESCYLNLWLEALSNNNAQGEYYLTDIIKMAVDQGLSINTVYPSKNWEVEGINSRIQLAKLERTWQRVQAKKCMLAGITLIDPMRFDLRGTLQHGTDITIDVNVILEGHNQFGQNIQIGANTVIKNCIIEDNVIIKENCVFENAFIGKESIIGPFARLRPEAKLLGHNHVGNFVEIKKSQIGEGSKINHLSYIGDTHMGETCNIGAGTITCNYDGANKWVTLIEDNAFIGSNSALVAPVQIGQNATIGAGSVITRNAHEDALTLTRAKQQSVPNWKRPTKD